MGGCGRSTGHGGLAGPRTAGRARASHHRNECDRCRDRPLLALR